MPGSHYQWGVSVTSGTVSSPFNPEAYFQRLAHKRRSEDPYFSYILFANVNSKLYYTKKPDTYTTHNVFFSI